MDSQAVGLGLNKSTDEARLFAFFVKSYISKSAFIREICVYQRPK